MSIRQFIPTIALLVLTGCSPPVLSAPSSHEISAALSSLPVGLQDVVFVGAGDIARCGVELSGAEATGRIVSEVLRRYPQAYAFTAGDNAYEDGTAGEFRDCYGKAWGKFNDRTFPAPGNHDYRSPGAGPYFGYFHYYRSHPAARASGYYGTDLGPGWHLVSLNNYLDSRGMKAELDWLEKDLTKAETAGRCTVAVWHDPLFSSGRRPEDTDGIRPVTAALWRQLSEHEGAVAISGHHHDYERFSPQDERGERLEKGVRQFVVGTGGAHLRNFRRALPNSEVRDAAHHGVLVLVLHPGSYDWAFIDTDGRILDRSSVPVRCGPGKR